MPRALTRERAHKSLRASIFQECPIRAQPSRSRFQRISSLPDQPRRLRLGGRFRANCAQPPASAEHRNVAGARRPVQRWRAAPDRPRRATSIDVSTLSRVVTRLVKMGLVTRARSANNSREVVVSLAGKGSALLTHMIPQAIAAERPCDRGCVGQGPRRGQAQPAPNVPRIRLVGARPVEGDLKFPIIVAVRLCRNFKSKNRT